MTEALNAHVAARLEEVAGILEWQGANPYRVRAYRRAALTLRSLARPVSELLASGGLPALEALPGIGESLARSIRSLVVTGRLPMLERLRGASDPVELLATVPGIGRRTAERLHHDLGVDTLEELEAAAHDGRLAALLGFGEKRLAGVRDSLAHRLSRVRHPAAGAAERGHEPAVAELLDVDREYREKASAGTLTTIAPRRLNPRGDAWLPVLHAVRGGRHYTALFSNTPRAHRMGATGDWVVLYWDGASGESQATVVTSRGGPMQGLRVVRGREDECARHHGQAPAVAG
ncbi:MAG TPA: helix-hairpin-helix domain-containing protein [Vicinamibacteria bacterium]|nr:helix-hairpin-helix domain-containing protein [Vicinamibacteria bacterium]